MLLTVQIPVFPHVLKFINKKHDNKFRVSKRHKEGKMLYHMLRNQEGKKRYEKQMAKYTGRLNVSIPSEYYKERGCSNITAQTIYDFNTFIDSIIKDEFIHYVEALRDAEVDVTVDQMVDGFMGKYNFDDGDITPWVLKQCYYRFKRDYKEKTDEI